MNRPRSMCAAAMACIAPALCVQPATAQKLIDYGGDVTCQTYLSIPAATKQGETWVLGFWSGLNAMAVIRNDKADVGRTMQASDIFSEVTQLCQKQPNAPMKAIVIVIYMHSRSDNR